jgi:hypothetical protein
MIVDGHVLDINMILTLANQMSEIFDLGENLVPGGWVLLLFYDFIKFEHRFRYQIEAVLLHL